MNRLRRLALFVGLVFVPSLACLAAALFLLYSGKLAGHHGGQICGLFILMSSMTVVPLVMWAMANRLIGSERARWQAELRRFAVNRRSGGARLRKLEKAVRFNRFVQRRPAIVPAFCLFAVVVGVCLFWNASKFESSAKIREGQIMGAVIFVPYLGVLTAYIYARLTGKWNDYIEYWIQKSEERLAQARAISFSESR